MRLPSESSRTTFGQFQFSIYLGISVLFGSLVQSTFFLQRTYVWSDTISLFHFQVSSKDPTLNHFEGVRNLCGEEVKSFRNWLPPNSVISMTSKEILFENDKMVLPKNVRPGNPNEFPGFEECVDSWNGIIQRARLLHSCS